LTALGIRHTRATSAKTKRERVERRVLEDGERIDLLLRDGMVVEGEGDESGGVGGRRERARKDGSELSFAGIRAEGR
jgi:hypothetical protein